MIDPLGLKTEAKYDYRVLQPELVVDANANSRRFKFTPLGLLKAALVQGKNNVAEGDRNRPSVELSYDLLAFSQRGQPASVRTRQYQHHDSDVDVPLPQRDEIIETVEYSDGFGRLLQTRVQSEEIRFGDATFGGGILPIDQSDETGSKLAFAGVRNNDANSPNVLVSGWQVYDNKGRVIEKFEPFYSQSWQYAAPGDTQLGQKAVMIYDPRGQVIRTLNPDGSEQRVLYGIPADLTNPEQFAPTPWEAYTYDANDNAGRTHAGASQAYQTHWNTPASIIIDALGRTVQATARNGAQPADWLVTLSRYDIRGNLLNVTDAMGRVAFRYGYDLANRPWRNASIDAGLRRTVLDALGNPVESRDSKGALILNGYDEGNRPHRLWARDGVNQSMTLRQVLIYGDRPDSGLSVDVARQKNLLGKLYQHYDEAGLVSVPGYDFKGNPLSQSRQALSDAVLLGAYQNAAERNWAIDAYRVNWQPPAGVTLAAHAQTLLDATIYETTSRYDGLNRIKSLRYPLDVNGQRQELLPVYNRAGGLAQVKLNGQLFVQQIAYSAKGQRVLVAYGNGVMSRYAYDDKTFRLLRLRSERYSQPQPDSFQPNGEALQDFAYRYDLVGNILQIEDRAQGSGILNNPAATTVGDTALAQLLASGNALLRQFAYDPIYRLLSATGRECDQAPETPPWLDQPRCTDLTRTRAYSQLYRYDALGNMQELKHQLADAARNRLFSTAIGNNRLDTVTIGQNIYRYAHDANGNMLSEHQTRLFDWDHSDRLKAFRTQVAGSEPSVHAQYLYDAGGMRVKKLTRKQGGQYTVTVYIGGLFEYHRAVQGATVQENNTLHVMDDQSRIALVRVGTPFPDDTTPAVKYYLGDHLVSSHVVIGGDGSWLNREEYTPYGETSFGSFARKRYRFTGKERDEESGLNYHAARYYAAWVVRWVSCDPIGIKAGINLYPYCKGNPVNFTDHTGTDISETNKSFDNNHDKKISLHELKAGLECTNISLKAWAFEMSFNTGGYRVDGYVQKLINVVNEASMSDSVTRAYKAEERNETIERRGTDGMIYTNREGRARTKRELNRYKDPKRIVPTLQVAGALLAPEIYFTSKSIYHSATGNPKQAVFDLAGVLFGRAIKSSSTPITETNIASQTGKTLPGIGHPLGPNFVYLEREAIAATGEAKTFPIAEFERSSRPISRSAEREFMRVFDEFTGLKPGGPTISIEKLDQAWKATVKVMGFDPMDYLP